MSCPPSIWERVRAVLKAVAQLAETLNAIALPALLSLLSFELASLKPASEQLDFIMGWAWLAITFLNIPITIQKLRHAHAR